MEQGLAQQQVPQGQEMIAKVVELLMQGMTPEELVQKGVPPEIVQQAIAMIQQQQVQQQPQAGDVGLAGRVTQGGL